jgi:Ca2+-binding EF-hand superfamily protein
MKNAFKAFDKNNHGFVDYEQFMKAIIGPMNMQRTMYVKKAFDTLDYT